MNKTAHNPVGKLVTSLLIFTLLALSWPHPETKAANAELLSSPWTLSASSGAKEAYQNVSPQVLYGQEKLTLSYNLHGLCVLRGDASAIIFDQNGWKYISLADYGQNCLDGGQTVEIPLSAFRDIDNGSALDTKVPLTGPFHVRIWNDKNFTVDITQATLGSSSQPSITPVSVTPTPVPTAAPSPAPTSTSTPATTSNFKGVTDGQSVSGLIYVSYKANPNNTRRVDFYVDGKMVNSEYYDPYYLGSDSWGQPYGWNTNQVSNGKHTIRATVIKTSGTSTTDTININVQNGTVTPPNPTSIPVPTSTPQITSIPTPTLVPNPTPTPTSVPSSGSSGNWTIQSVDSMKSTKDAICGQRDINWINKFLDKAVELGATHVAIDTPYDNPSCGDALAYTKTWVTAARNHGLKVWHRHMPLAFEGIYNAAKSKSNFLTMISNYVKNNSSLFANGDIFTPIPEPQNGGINGVTGCANGVCQYDSAAAFNQWLRDAMDTSTQAFQSIGKSVKIGYFGFDGFVAWGDNNPDWNGILEDSTIQKMGHIAVDHYPEVVNDNMANDLKELEARYPGVPIIISEWGTINGQNTEQEVKNSMGAAANDKNVAGFNYWQFGPEGSGEQLIDDNFNNQLQFNDVQYYYKGGK
jgi:hypothetical protein